MSESELEYELLEARSEIDRHHTNFRVISDLVDAALAGELETENVLKAIRGVVG